MFVGCVTPETFLAENTGLSEITGMHFSFLVMFGCQCVTYKLVHFFEYLEIAVAGFCESSPS